MDEKKCDVSSPQCCLIRSEGSVRQAGLALSHNRQPFPFAGCLRPQPQAQSSESEAARPLP